MGSYTTLKNTPLYINLADDIIDQGWSISGGFAYHDSCNSGYIEKTFDLSSDTEWTFEYTIPSVTTGGISLIVGDQEGDLHTSSGTFTETFTITGSNVLVRFFSTGENVLELLKIYPENDKSGAITWAFNEDFDRWCGNHSYTPEMYGKFVNSLFVFRDGEIWEQNVNEVRNNFFGEQFTSQIKYYVNVNPTEIKEFFTMRQKSNKPWAVIDAYIAPTEGKQEGQRSRIKKGNFKALQEDFFASFLRNMEDPRYGNELDALMKGGALQGSCIEITLENDDVVEVRLLSVDVEVAPQQYTY